jgi:membrane protease YdiL (CAAX protease family)
VLAFFLLTYGISWSVLSLYFSIFQGDQNIGVLIEPLVVFSPALTAMFISGIAEPNPKQENSRPRRIAFFVSWIICAPILIGYAWVIYKIEEVAVVVIVFGILSTFPAWVLSGAFSRTPGIRKHFSTLVRPRGSVWLYLVVLLFFPVVLLIGMWVTRLIGGEAQFYLADLPIWEVALLLLLEFLHVFLMTGGINEECGWRGFALPRLQSRYPVLMAALIVGYVWALWHIPVDIATGVPKAWMLQNRLIWNPMFAILMAWLYNRTNGSILAPVIFHAAMNAFGNQFSFTIAGNVLFIGVTVFVIVYDRMWEVLPTGHGATYRTSWNTGQMERVHE